MTEDSSETVVEKFVALAEPQETAHALAEHMVECTRASDVETAQRWAGRCGDLEAQEPG